MDTSEANIYMKKQILFSLNCTHYNPTPRNKNSQDVAQVWLDLCNLWSSYLFKLHLFDKWAESFLKWSSLIFFFAIGLNFNLEFLMTPLHFYFLSLVNPQIYRVQIKCDLSFKILQPFCAEH